mmetsp:Transcript_1977/g.4467  ORF Transcript_1977/g.4467 Transcript_1977/m.4467 type:complete len:251 (-) Transcript_1977:484-1236(-)
MGSLACSKTSSQLHTGSSPYSSTRSSCSAKASTRKRKFGQERGRERSSSRRDAVLSSWIPTRRTTKTEGLFDLPRRPATRSLWSSKLTPSMAVRRITRTPAGATEWSVWYSRKSFASNFPAKVSTLIVMALGRTIKLFMALCSSSLTFCTPTGKAPGSPVKLKLTVGALAKKILMPDTMGIRGTRPTRQTQNWPRTYTLVTAALTRPQASWMLSAEPGWKPTSKTSCTRLSPAISSTSGLLTVLAALLTP